MKLRFLKGQAEIDQYWPDICPIFQSVIDRAGHGEYTVDDLYASAIDGSTTIGVAREGEEVIMALAFAFKQYPQKTGVNVYALGGKRLFEFMDNFLEKFKEFCTMAGADWIEASCSPGMTRMHKRNGFETVYQALRLYL